ncbi:MAG: NAD(+)/NADH kinase [Gammaproteobacteria bacterium]|nr:NAD(+)/NADH kinase [Gammaproteobacteria bacterium]
MGSSVGILVNPMSGRDVRRLAARATAMTFEMKRDTVARVAAGADAAGADELVVVREPFQIATGALEHMPLDARVTILDLPITHSDADTVLAIQRMRGLGCGAIVSIGGDGTNRIIARTWPDVLLVPLSTGTNNVFPVMTEATSAGAAAALVARSLVDIQDVSRASKTLTVTGDGIDDIALIDAVLLRRDHVGNLLPFDPARIDRLVLTTALPDAVGTSPIGGLLHPVSADDDGGLYVICGEGRRVYAPISPGLFRHVGVKTWTLLSFGDAVTFVGPGVIALDGDRCWRLDAGAEAQVRLAREGPRRIDVRRTMFLAAQQELFREAQEIR